MDYDLNLSWNWRELRSAFFSPEPYVTIDTTRGGGKTRGGFLWLTKELFATNAQNGLWFDTVHNNIDAYVLEHLEQVILKNIWSLCDYNEKKKKLFLPNGKYIQFASADKPENAEGFRYHRVVLNEGGIILKKASLWDNSIEPMTHPRDGIANKTRIIGTMKGKNKFHQLCKLDDKDWKNYHFSVYDCPNYKAEEIESIKRKTPQLVFKQEYLSEAIDKSGSVFRDMDKNIREIYTTQGDVMSVDLAKYQDFTVIMVGNTNTKEVVNVDRFNEIDWTLQKKRILATWQQFDKPKLIIDSTGIGDAIFDDLKRLGIYNLEPFKFTSESKRELIENLSIALTNSEIYFPKNVTLINEMEVFEYSLSSAGNIKLSAPEGMHDDMVIALALLNRIMVHKTEINLSWI